MNIICDFPPMWSEIDAKFKLREKRLTPLFCWGQTIYNPFHVSVPKQLIAHERVHASQQFSLGGPEQWWVRYIEDAEFRLNQELPAHKAELAALLNEYGNNRDNRRRYLKMTAQRLRAPLYQFQLGDKEARALLEPALA